MNGRFERAVFHGYLVKGQLKDAMRYLACFPDQAALYQKYLAIFEREEYLALSPDGHIDELLLIYQKYFREVFYLGLDAVKAVENMQNRFVKALGLKERNMEFSELEQTHIAGEFHDRSYQFLGGRTGGYYGPYIWKTVERRNYDVELPDGVQRYPVNLLDDFVFQGWYDYLSFGEIGTGGWTNGDGVINCIRSSYDLEDESFTVSLLKHEAQHTADLSKYPNMPSDMLEYRAKLVELIYSEKRALLTRFLHEAGEANGHPMAAKKIAEGFMKRLGKTAEELAALPVQNIQKVAREMFAESNETIEKSP